MRLHSFVALLPALLLVSACGSPPVQGTTAGDSDSGSSSGSTSGGSATTDNTNGGACVPGDSVACSCNNGMMGAQVCNASGSGYEPCMCTGGTSTTNPTTDPTTTATTDPSTTAPSTTTGDVTASTGAPDTTTTDTSASTGTTDTASTGAPDTTGGGDMPYGPCPGGQDSECLDGEICVTGNSMMMMWSICTTGECGGGGDCDVTPDDDCADAPGDGQFVEYCLPFICDMNNPCPMGMTCFPGFMGQPSVCLWPGN